jgi:hypothetical protein
MPDDILRVNSHGPVARLPAQRREARIVSPVEPLARIEIGVVVERRRAKSAWTDFVWRPTAILAGRPEAEPWTVLATEGDCTTFYAGPAEIDLYRTETGQYRDNLASGAPLLWVALRPTGADPAYRP